MCKSSVKSSLLFSCHWAEDRYPRQINANQYILFGKWIVRFSVHSLVLFPGQKFLFPYCYSLLKLSHQLVLSVISPLVFFVCGRGCLNYSCVCACVFSQSNLVEEYFEAHSSSKVVTSDRTLQKLAKKKLDQVRNVARDDCICRLFPGQLCHELCLHFFLYILCAVWLWQTYACMWSA